ncbi:hypothetical protein V1477_021073 [Vespula maculifrons]|uniref:Uncharacterized protein n=1 Tax=Vespula maculifrons TaxID=7453 RepID=A0ABD2AH29_VESMC
MQITESDIENKKKYESRMFIHVLKNELKKNRNGTKVSKAILYRSREGYYRPPDEHSVVQGIEQGNWIETSGCFKRKCYLFLQYSLVAVEKFWKRFIILDNAVSPIDNANNQVSAK